MNYNYLGFNMLQDNEFKQCVNELLTRLSEKSMAEWYCIKIDLPNNEGYLDLKGIKSYDDSIFITAVVKQYEMEKKK